MVADQSCADTLVDMIAKQTFLSDAFGQVASLNRSGWLALACFGFFSSAMYLVGWWSGPHLTMADYVGMLLTATLWIAATYVASLSMLSRPLKLAGLIRFGVATLILISPIIFAVAGFLLLRFIPNKEAFLIGCVILLLIGWLLLTMLPALPIAQAMSPTFVSPTKLWRSTKGHRFSLLIASIIAGSINKMTPGMSTANGLEEAVAIALWNGMMSAAAVLIAACVAVTAWQYACDNEPALKAS
jgi:hypothetical protein